MRLAITSGYTPGLYKSLQIHMSNRVCSHACGSVFEGIVEPMAGQPHLFQLQISMVEDILRNHLHSHLMWIKQCHKPPMTGNGNHTNYKNCAGWGGGLWHCFTMFYPHCSRCRKCYDCGSCGHVPWCCLHKKQLTAASALPEKQGFT